ncbi:tetratricopeptide repeat protein (plasmid) [Rhizobium lusitanum]|uniref:tetratricopeptide repeat protein n=1 Tax=Rhizobium lusitanum TaxID=293958 RepID=UPI00161957A8|nr:tetratricopeptide repeat protein [Rhizobium lusitanum]QND46065.1 tetratricopeptide repeat protein [Rhizobium lusitanum]
MNLRKLFLMSVAVALFGWGDAYAGSDDVPTPQLCSTIRDCTKLIDKVKDPTQLAQALVNRCSLRLSLLLDESTEDCDRAIAIEPNLVSAFEARSRINAFLAITAFGPAKKQTAGKQAQEDLDKVVELAPHQARSYLLRGRHMMLTKRYELALRDFNEAASLSPEDPLVYLQRSSVYKSLGKDDLALKDGDKFLAIAPPRASVLTMMAEIYLARHQLQQALPLADRAVELGAANGKDENFDLNNALTKRGSIYVEMGDQERAKQDFVAAISAAPSATEAREALGALLNKHIPSDMDCSLAAVNLSQESQLNAIKICTDLLDVAESTLARDQRARLYMGTKQYDLAAADFSKLIEADPKDIGSYLFRAQAYHRADKQDLALADINKSLEEQKSVKVLDPEASRRIDLILRAQIEMALGLHAEAQQDISEVLAKAPQTPDALAIRAWLKTRQGDLAGAKNDLDLAMATNTFIYRGWFTKVQDALGRGSQAEADAAFRDAFRGI